MQLHPSLLLLTVEDGFVVEQSKHKSPKSALSLGHSQSLVVELNE